MTGGPENHTCVTTAVIRQCYFAQGTTVLNPFQVLVKVTAIFWDNHAYSWVNFASNTEQESFEIISNNASDPSTFEQNIYTGQTMPKLPGFSNVDGPARLYYQTSVFGPLDWDLLGPRFNSQASVAVKLCKTSTDCSTYSCIFGVDKPVLTPADVGL